MNASRLAALSLLSIAVLVAPAARAAPAVTTLTDGATVPNLSGALGSTRIFRVQVPAGARSVSFVTTGGAGDCDLYVRRDALPTLQTFDARSITPTCAESVRLDRPAAGWYYALVFGAAPFQNVPLTVQVRGARPRPPAVRVAELQNGVVAYGISGQAGTAQYFRIAVPVGATELSIVTSGTGGDCDLYAQLGALPVQGKAKYSSTGPACNEKVTIATPPAGEWYILLQGYSSFQNAKLVAEYKGAAPPPPPVPPQPPVPPVPPVPGVHAVDLQNGVPAAGLSGAAGTAAYFRIAVPVGATDLTITTAGTTGDCDLFVAYNEAPAPGRARYTSTGPASTERVVIAKPRPGNWYILVQGYSPFANVTVTAVYRGVAPPGGGPGHGMLRLLLTSPTSQSVWAIGTTQTISWTASRGVRYVRLEYSRDDGRTWTRTSLPAQVPAAVGTYSWAIPRDLSYASSKARLRVTGVSYRGRTVPVVTQPFQVLGAPRPGHPWPGHGPGHGPRPVPIARDAYEPNESGPAAKLLPVGRPQVHTIFPKEDQDWMRIVTPPGRYQITFDRIVGIKKLKVEAYLHNPVGNRVQRINKFEFRGPGQIRTVVPPAFTQILVRVRAEDDDEVGAYRVSVQRVP